MTTNPLGRMSPEEFRAEGYLQEVNRRFLHPLGLALAIATDGVRPELVVLDGRDNPSGWTFEGVDLKPHAENIDRLMAQRKNPRRDALNYLIQST